MTGATASDGLARLWAPQRMAYIKGENKPATTGACPFCRIPGEPAEESLVVARGELVYAVLNLYPYNPGHLMICPYRHVADYTDLTDAEAIEFTAFTQRGLHALRAATGAEGCNVGMNLGTAAGAGIAAHLHQHLVPRWAGDTNFMTVVSQTKVLPQLLTETRDTLQAHWA